MELQRGIDYPLTLGPSLLGSDSAGEQFLTLRYNFRPESASQATQGRMELHPSGQVQLQLGDSLMFQGECKPAGKDGLDCIAVFDGKSLRLELLTAAVQGLKHVQGASRGTGGRSGMPASRGVTPEPFARGSTPEPASAGAQVDPGAVRSAFAEPRVQQQQQHHQQLQPVKKRAKQATAGAAPQRKAAASAAVQQQQQQQQEEQEPAKLEARAGGEPSALDLEQALLQALEDDMADDNSGEQPVAADAGQQQLQLNARQQQQQQLLLEVPVKQQQATQQQQPVKQQQVREQEQRVEAMEVEKTAPPADSAGGSQEGAGAAGALPKAEQQQQEPEEQPPVQQPSGPVVTYVTEGQEMTDLDHEFFASL